MYHIVNDKQLYIIQKSKQTRLGCFYVAGILSWKCGWGWDFAWVWFEAEVEYGWV